ncbi:hypothetical protein DDW13_06100 [Acidianus hospitalis]|uniref:Uncharacterized protein n=1 Tax=Acidianus hospitalis TaxID=563177 RepID=A0A2T9X3Z6_9CREN|nr:hypothetical protein DDW13_06100 [Acidianus hospitalis]
MLNRAIIRQEVLVENNPRNNRKNIDKGENGFPISAEASHNTIRKVMEILLLRGKLYVITDNEGGIRLIRNKVENAKSPSDGINKVFIATMKNKLTIILLIIVLRPAICYQLAIEIKSPHLI